MNQFKKIRTCSRVSSGPCYECKGQTYFHVYRHITKHYVLCRDCYEQKYEPAAHQKRQEETKKAREQTARDLKLGREGKLPGAKISKNGAVFGPVQNWYGVPCRQILSERLYDTEPFIPSESETPLPPSLFSNFKAFGEGKGGFRKGGRRGGRG